MENCIAWKAGTNVFTRSRRDPNEGEGLGGFFFFKFPRFSVRDWADFSGDKI